MMAPVACHQGETFEPVEIVAREGRCCTRVAISSLSKYQSEDSSFESCQGGIFNVLENAMYTMAPVACRESEIAERLEKKVANINISSVSKKQVHDVAGSVPR
jgi:hypothetical protein